MEGFNYSGYKMIVQSRESDLLDYLGRQIPKIYGKENCVITSQYIFAHGKIPIVLCSHMDTIFSELTPPKTILYDQNQELICSPDGIGGDDRNGIYIILSIINKFRDNLPCVLFTTQEEKGCIGAKAAAIPLKEHAKDLKFAIQIDRHGVDDAVFYSCANKKFIEYICSFGYKEQYGSCTDICKICPEWNIAGVNFSCGYVNEHNKNEVVNVKDMFSTMNMVCKILEDNKNSKKFSYYVKNKAPTTKTQYLMAPETQNKDGLASKEFFNASDDALLMAIYGKGNYPEPLT